MQSVTVFALKWKPIPKVKSTRGYDDLMHNGNPQGISISEMSSIQQTVAALHATQRFEQCRGLCSHRLRHQLWQKHASPTLHLGPNNQLYSCLCCNVYYTVSHLGYFGQRHHWARTKWGWEGLSIFLEKNGNFSDKCANCTGSSVCFIKMQFSQGNVMVKSWLLCFGIFLKNPRFAQQ